MKKSLAALLAFSLVLGLSSCNETPTLSNSESSPSDSASGDVSSNPSAGGIDLASSGNPSLNDSQEASSENGGGVASIDSEEGSDSNAPDRPSSWSDSDLAVMSLYLNGYTDLPFPIGFSADYVEASGTDADGECFIAYDSSCGDLSPVYSVLLEEEGFVFDPDSSGEDEDIPYYTYYLDLEDSLDSIYVQYYYDMGDFQIFAWVETANPSSLSFPYAEIASFLGKDSLSESEIPSFELAEGEAYSYYSIEEGYECFVVYGALASDVNEDNYVAGYASSLAEAGYTVSEQDQVAVSAEFGIEADYMASEGVFYLILSAYQEASAGDHSLTFSASDFPSSYAETTLTKEGIVFSLASLMNSQDVIQFRNANKGSGYLMNSTPIDEIASLVITAKSLDYYGILSLYVSASPISETNVGTEIEPNQSGSSFTYNVNVEGVHYFKLIDEQETASKNTEIVLNYSVA